MSYYPKQRGTTEQEFSIGAGTGKFPFTIDATSFTNPHNWVIPDSDGSLGDALTTDGSGNLSWSTLPGQTPYEILSGETFTVQAFSQVLFAEPILVDDGGSLVVNGSLIEVATSAGAAAGSDTQVQYNSAGVFAANSGFTYNSAGGITLSNSSSFSEINLNLATIQSDPLGNTTVTAGIDPTFSGNGILALVGGGVFNQSIPVTGGNIEIAGGNTLYNVSSTGGAVNLTAGIAISGYLTTGVLQGGPININSGNVTDNGGFPSELSSGQVSISSGQVNATNISNPSVSVYTGNVTISSGQVNVLFSQTGAVNSGNVIIQAGQIGEGGEGSTAPLTGGSVLIKGADLNLIGAAVGGQTPGGVVISGGVEIYAPGKVGTVSITNTDLQILNIGSGLKVKSGTNCKLGQATLSAGSVVVSNTSVTSNSNIFTTIQDPNGGTPGALYLTAITAGTGFTINSTSLLDTSIVSWNIIESI